MTREEFKAAIIKIVYDRQGLKATELATEAPISDFSLVEILEEAVKENKIQEIEYCVPQWPKRIKSFLLPSGARINMGDNWK